MVTEFSFSFLFWRTVPFKYLYFFIRGLVCVNLEQFTINTLPMLVSVAYLCSHCKNQSSRVYSTKFCLFVGLRWR